MASFVIRVQRFVYYVQLINLDIYEVMPINYSNATVVSTLVNIFFAERIIKPWNSLPANDDTFKSCYVLNHLQIE